jgi:uncharacterized membrane protein YidH (DUF202 family)
MGTGTIEEEIMTLVSIGALLIIIGVVLAATAQLRRGRLSEQKPPESPAPSDTLEPTGRGRNLNLKVDMPGVALIAIGAILMLAAAAT